MLNYKARTIELQEKLYFTDETCLKCGIDMTDDSVCYLNLNIYEVMVHYIFVMRTQMPF